MRKALQAVLDEAADYREQGQLEKSLKILTEHANGDELPEPEIALQAARVLASEGYSTEAAGWLRSLVDTTEEFTLWQAAGAVYQDICDHSTDEQLRTARIAVLGSYTITQFVPLLKLAALRWKVNIEVYESGFGQIEQEVLNPNSGLYAFKPDFVILMVHAGATRLSAYTAEPENEIATEFSRWQTIWQTLIDQSSAQILMHNFVVPFEEAFGNLACSQPGTRSNMLDVLNRQIAERSPAQVSILDVEKLAANIGREHWFNDRYWYMSKQSVSFPCLPMLAKKSAAQLSAHLGLAKKCLVLDLDNTLWGGVIGEDGLQGISLGAGVNGEAFVAFQRYILALKRRGIILAVCSKNNEADAMEPFNKHPDMQLSLDDIALFVANWKPKPENLQYIAQTLNIGLDSLVFVDDNPAEREIVRQLVPEVEVVTLPKQPTGYLRALAGVDWFESVNFTEEDLSKTEKYKAKAATEALEAKTESIEDFYRSLDMQAEIAPFDELHLPRIVQLIGKTNQFNLTTKRRTQAEVESLMQAPDHVHFYLKLKDRFVDHGLVGLMIAHRQEETLSIDTWLMSCRVIGRTAENAMLAYLGQQAGALGCTKLRGRYIPSKKNKMVEDLFAKFGFRSIDSEISVPEGSTDWEYDLSANDNFENPWIRV